MNTSSLVKAGMLVVGGSLLLTGCVVRRERVVYRERPAPVVVTEPVGQEVVVTEAPPAPIVETVTVSPGPDFIWVGGCWVWRGRWVWEHGHWGRPPHVGAVWVPHHYVYRAACTCSSAAAGADGARAVPRSQRCARQNGSECSDATQPLHVLRTETVTLLQSGTPSTVSARS